MSLLYIKLCSKLHCCGKFIVFLTFFSWNLLCNIRRHSKEKKEEKNKRKKESIHFIHGTFIKIFINYGMTAINQSPFIFYQIINREEEGGVMVSNCIITIHIHIPISGLFRNGFHQKLFSHTIKDGKKRKSWDKYTTL